MEWRGEYDECRSTAQRTAYENLENDVVHTDVLVAVGCGRGVNAPSGKESGADRKESEKPVPLDQMEAVSLTMFKDNGVPVEKIQELVSKRLLQVQLTIMKSAKGSTIDDIVASGQIPDLLSYSLGGLWK
jgi:hypothetical protein